MFENIINDNKYITYLNDIGVETEPIKDKIQLRLTQDKKRQQIFDKFANRIYDLTSFNVYVENIIFEELNLYLFENFNGSVIFEEDVRIDVKTIIAYKNALIERPNISKPSGILDGFCELEKINEFVRIARFENEILIENSRRIGNKIVFQGVVPIKELIHPFFDCTANLTWIGEFLTDNPCQLIGLHKQFNSIEAKYILWPDSQLVDMLDLKVASSSWLLACNNLGETILKFRCWREDLIGADMNDNVVKSEGCDLLLREDYFVKLESIVGKLFYISRGMGVSR